MKRLRRLMTGVIGGTSSIQAKAHSDSGAASIRSASRAEAGSDQLGLVLFDFDQTLSIIHLYHHLHRLSHSNGVNHSDRGLAQVEALASAYGSQEQFVQEVFGGEERLADLKSTLSKLSGLQPPAEMVVVTHGYEKVVRKALQRSGLAAFFSDVVGRDSKLMADARGLKQVVAAKLRAKHKALPEATLLVDDDCRNLEDAREAGTCRTMWVWGAKGLTSAELRTLRERGTAAHQPSVPFSESRSLETTADRPQTAYFRVPGAKASSVADAVSIANRAAGLFWEGTAVVESDAGNRFVLWSSSVAEPDELLDKLCPQEVPRLLMPQVRRHVQHADPNAGDADEVKRRRKEL